MESKKNSTDLTSIQHALYTTNRHAKTALHSSELYELKKKTLKKLMGEKLAEKVCIEYSRNPGKGLQSSVVLVKVGTAHSKQPFYFHTIVEKDDFKQLVHTGKSNSDCRNPRVQMGLETAKTILYNYIGETPRRKRTKLQQQSKKRHLDTVFVSSYLDGRKR